MVRAQDKSLEEAAMGNVRTEEVKVDVDGQEMPAFLALPEGAGQHPAVIVFQEIFGINVHMREVSERLAREGYVAIAPDYHHRAWTPGTQLGYAPAERQRGMELISKLTFEGLSADIKATIAYLGTRKEANVERLGAIGFCIGGHAAYFAAATAPVKATASFYGGGIATFGQGGTPTVTRSKDIKGKIICFFGGNDQMIPPAQVETIKQALQAGHVAHEVVVYDGASHAFFCDVAERGSFVPAAAADAWERVKKLFAAELKG
jgi:carboxymethylenebutenolidase